MAEPGDPSDRNARSPNGHDRSGHDSFGHDHDDLIGFSSAASLVGRERRPPEPEPEPAAEIEPELPFDAYEPVAALEPAPVIWHEPEPVVPSWAIETPRPSPASAPASPAQAFGRANRAPEPVEGAMGLYTVYALILFAVPTLGVSALLGLLFVIGRGKPEQPLARSHFVFQKRTLLIAAVAAVVGVVLIAAPLGIGVLILFVLALWLVVRGARGVMLLKGSEPIAQPMTWLI